MLALVIFQPYIIRILMLFRSTVVQHLIQESLKAGDLVAHFFFSHSNKTRLEATHLFQSYIKQILGYLYMTRNPCPSRIVSYVKQFYGYKRYPPSFDEVIDEIFLPLSALLPSTTYVVDGLDECEPEQVREILKTFQKMGSRRGLGFLSLDGKPLMWQAQYRVLTRYAYRTSITKKIFASSLTGKLRKRRGRGNLPRMKGCFKTLRAN
jgi:hypothetical protein